MMSLLILAACSRDADEPAPTAAPAGVPISGVRRLSRDECDNTLRDLLGDDTRPCTALLPEDVVDPFDNDVATQDPSAVLIAGWEVLANDVATRFVADSSRRAAFVPCAPDDGCLTTFVEDFGRLALRRPLAADEVAAYVGLGAAYTEESGDFWEGIDTVVRALLQSPEFTYRVEIGAATDDPAVFRLDGYELATRLSYLLWGTTPDDALLDLAGSGGLASSAALRAQAVEMLADPRAVDRLDRFHALWLGYGVLPHEAWLTDALREETRRLVEENAIVSRAPYGDLFTGEGTWISDELAAHYALPLPGSDEPVFVPYGDSGRRGLFSTGSFLSVAAKYGDTSPTQRGRLVRERLLCSPVPPPPPDVNVDEPPEDPESECKVDDYAAHREAGSSCQGCHDLMDPIGFGLEGFDAAGRARDHDLGAPECPISGEGELDGVPFVGPAGLSALLVADPSFASCVVTQAWRFAMGRVEGPDDLASVDALAVGFSLSATPFDALLLGLVADDAFLFRREE